MWLLKINSAYLDIFQVHNFILHLYHLRCHGALSLIIHSAKLLDLVIESFCLNFKFVFQLFLIQAGFLQRRL